MEPSDYEREEKEEKKPSKTVTSLLEWMEDLAGALVIIAILFTFVFRIITVTGRSMEPTYMDGDRVMVVDDVLGVKQGDVVVITNVLSEPIIKRVIATEGQTVDIDFENGNVIIDGQILDETQFGLENGITKVMYSSLDLLEFPQQVPEGYVFVLGDNRQISEDSRYREVGMIDRQNILGKAVLYIYPFSKIGLAK